MHNFQELASKTLHDFNFDKFENKKQTVFKRIVHERNYEGENRYPAVPQIQQESYITIIVCPTKIDLRDYKNTKTGEL